MEHSIFLKRKKKNKNDISYISGIRNIVLYIKGNNILEFICFFSITAMVDKKEYTTK